MVSRIETKVGIRVQSIRALMVEFLPEKFSIGTKSGLIVDRTSIIDPDLKPDADNAARKL